MTEQDKRGKRQPKPAQPATEGYKILQELKAIHDVLKDILKELRQNL